jgi:hypothetical protein
MRNVSDKVVGKIATKFYVSNVFPKMILFMKQSGKIRKSQIGHRFQYNAVNALCLLDI